MTSVEANAGHRTGWWVPTAGSGADTPLLHRFTTRKGRQVCANPDARWVKEYINFLELQ